MKSTPARPSFRTATPGHHREDASAVIRALSDERAQLQQRVADLEAVLQATIEVLQARVAPHPAAVTSSAMNARSPLNRARRLALRLVLLLVATAAIPAVLYLRKPVLSFATGGHAGTGNEPANQAAAPTIDTKQQAAAPSVATPDMRPEPPLVTPVGPAVGSQRPSDGLTIALDTRDRCWIGATLDGKRKLERLMKRGETTILHALDEVVLKTGNAGALSLTINGLAAAPLGRKGQTVTTRITLANYMRFTQQAQHPGRAGATGPGDLGRQ